MRSILLEYLSEPSKGGMDASQKKQASSQTFPSLALLDSLGFIDNRALKMLCQQSLESARICHGQGLHLPGVVLVGSALEGILLSIAEQRPEQTQAEFNKSTAMPKSKANWNLGLLLKVAKGAGWITESGGYRLGNALRDYRNLIHPAKYVEDAVILEAPDFLTAWLAVEKVVSEIDRWNKEAPEGLDEEQHNENP